MAEYQTIRTAGGVRTAAIDEGLRAHMNKVYGTMSVGMVITAAAAWALSGLAMSTEPTAYQIGANTYLTEFGATLWTSPLKWVIMFLPLVMIFAFGAMVNRLSAAGAQLFFYTFECGFMCGVRNTQDDNVCFGSSFGITRTAQIIAT